MKEKKSRRVKMLLSLVVVCGLFFGLGSTFLEAGICEDAFMLCLVENLFFSSYGATYCMLGYVFCLKYVQSEA
ncbi:MAG: hypothetical protein WCC06_07560 [Candidatus Aminicenantales bacterium]